MARPSNPSYGLIAGVYSVLYLVAVVLDHLSTVVAMSLGASESNPLFQVEDGGLAHFRAIGVFVMIWPLMLGCLWVGRTRAAHGDAAWSHPVVNRIIGRTAFSALRVPLMVAIIKVLAGLLNTANLVLPVSTTQLLRAVLTPIGIWSPSLGYFLSAAILLAITAWLARWPTRYLLNVISAHPPTQGTI